MTNRSGSASVGLERGGVGRAVGRGAGRGAESGGRREAVAVGVGVASADRLHVALAVLRVAVGIIFMAHGAQKLFEFGLPGVIGAFSGMGVPLPVFTGPAVALLEFFGGIAFTAGLLTRLVAVGLAVDMLGAMLLVHLPGGFFLPSGVEFTLALFAAAVALALTGPGAYSVDGVLARRGASR